MYYYFFRCSFFLIFIRLIPLPLRKDELLNIRCTVTKAIRISVNILFKLALNLLPTTKTRIMKVRQMNMITESLITF